jgi:HK97 family phage major capsid protein
MEIKDQLTEILGQLKEQKSIAAEQEKKYGTMNEDLKSKLEALQKQADALDVKLAERHAATVPDEPVKKFLEQHEPLQKLMRDKSGNCVIHFEGKHMAQLERKTNVTDIAVGFATSGVLLPERIPGIVPEARQELLVRDAFVARPTTQAFVDFVKVNAKMGSASPQTEATDKGENAVTFTSVSEKVRTLATWIPASKQVLDDMDELMNYLQTTLPYYVNLYEDQQFLSGNGSDPNVHGLIPQATAFNTALLSSTAGWNRIDMLGRAIQQITAAAEFAPTFFVVHPNDWWSIRLTKDNYGRYVLGDPQQPAGVAVTGGTIRNAPNVFGLLPIVTTSITSGTWLVGSGNPIAAEIRDRMGMTVEIATQHSTFFTSNLIAIRAEKRTVLLTKRPASFITGTWSTSPVVAGL